MKSKLRILYIIPAGLSFGPYGGAAAVCFRQALLMAKRGHDVTVYTTSAYDATYQVQTGLLRFRKINIYIRKLLSNTLAYKYKIFIAPKMFIEIWKELNSYDIVHIHDIRTLQTLIVVLRRMFYQRGPLIILQPHGALSYGNRLQIIKRIFDIMTLRFIIKNVDLWIALNPTEAGTMKKIGINKHKIVILPNGIDSVVIKDSNLIPKTIAKRHIFYNLRVQKRTNRIILYLGRLHKNKRLDLLLAASKYLPQDSMLLFVGPDDAYAKQIKKYIYLKKVQDKVRYIGYVNEELKRLFLCAADVLVIPQFFGFPLTILEAIMCRTPIVTTTLSDKLCSSIENLIIRTKPYPQDIAMAIYNILYNDTSVFINNIDYLEGLQKKQLLETFLWKNIIKKLEYIYYKNLCKRGR